MRLPAVPDSLPVQVSADNRYKLFVNGQLVSLGPARGDITHWKFVTVDLAPFLKPGSNCVTAQVWNKGKTPGGSPLRTALSSRQPGRKRDRGWNTDTAWRCRLSRR